MTIELDTPINGANTIIIHATDLAGNVNGSVLTIDSCDPFWWNWIDGTQTTSGI